MALRTTTNISIDFYDKKYILINAKQFDKLSRFLLVTCYNHGEIYPINAGEHSAYVRYAKPDNNSVFNFCEIDNKGRIVLELTEQMLASDGICCVDLVVVNKGKANVDAETGEIVAIDNSSILSTMPLYIDVIETAVNNSDIESSYEFNGLNDLIERAEADYEEVILTSKSWAVGNTNIRDGENSDNAKYYANQSSNSASSASTSALNAANSESLAEEHMHDALTYSQNAQTYMENAKTYMDESKIHMDNAKISETNAENSETNAKNSETNAATSEINAQTYMDEAYMSEQNAKTSEINAKTSETNAESYMNAAKASESNALKNANKAQSYAVGGTDTRDGEDNDNAYYYYGLIKNIVVGLDSGFIPMGTVTFAELTNVEKATGYVYNISDDFITDESFREGGGRSYTAGTNVYYTASGLWDAFGGTSSPAATVDEVKDYLGI